MKPTQAEYDIDNNEWLALMVDKLDAADEVKAYMKKKNAKSLRKATFHFVKKSRLEINKADTNKTETAKRQLVNATKAVAAVKEQQEKDISEKFMVKVEINKRQEFAHNPVNGTEYFVEQRFIKKYKGADTSVAMRTLDKQKRNAETFYTDADLRRQSRLFDDNCKKVARLVSRELCQEQDGVKISCKNPSLRQKMYLFNDVKKVTRLMLNDLRQK